MCNRYIRKTTQKHFKHRKLISLKQRLAILELEKEEGKVSLCFGGKKLFHAQYNLEKNDYDSLEAWKKDWEDSRSSEFFCIGSFDETSGNHGKNATTHKTALRKNKISKLSIKRNTTSS